MNKNVTQLLADAYELLRERSSYSDEEGEEYNGDDVCAWLDRYREIVGKESGGGT